MRSPRAPIYGLIFLTQLIWIAIVPVAPTFAERLHLSRLQLGVVLAAASIATCIVSLPIGVLADRVGTKTLVRAASLIIVLSTVGQAFAFDFWALLVARALYGIALGVIWTAGLAWLADTGQTVSTLALPTVVAGVAIVIGPAFAGLVADAAGVRAPFLILAVASALVTAALFAAPSPTPDEPPPPQRLLETLRRGSRERTLVGSLAVMALLGVVSGGVNLLVPVQLRLDGLSDGSIGLALSGGSILFVATGLAVSRLGAAAVTLRLVGLSALVYGCVIVLPSVARSAAAIVVFALVRAPFWSVLSTLSYPLGALGAHRAGVGRGAVVGLLNLVWGAASALGPVAAGAVLQLAGFSTAFALLAALTGGVGLALVAVESSRFLHVTRTR